MKGNSARKLLIISCSKTKRKLTEGTALEVYDGPFYKVLRKNFPDNLDVLILSAKYGLIEHTKRISPYNVKMTMKKAKNFRADSTSKLLDVLLKNNYSDIFVEMGNTYRKAIDFEILQQSRQNLNFDYGPIGVRLHNLKKWLTLVKEQENPHKTAKDIN